MLSGGSKVRREAGAWHECGQLSPAETTWVLLACAVDLGHYHLIGLPQADGEVVTQRRVARVAVGLEDQHQASVVQLTSRRKCCPDLGRVMAVVVVDRCALPCPQPLHPPVCAWERGQRLCSHPRFDPEL